MCCLILESLWWLNLVFLAHPVKKKWSGMLVIIRKGFASKHCIRGGWRHGSVQSCLRGGRRPDSVQTLHQRGWWPGSVAVILATLVPAPEFSSQNQCEKLGIEASICNLRPGGAEGLLGFLARQPGLLGERLCSKQTWLEAEAQHLQPHADARAPLESSVYFTNPNAFCFSSTV